MHDMLLSDEMLAVEDRLLREMAARYGAMQDRERTRLIAEGKIKIPEPAGKEEREEKTA